ncbi:unnamed protein product [Rotaria sp. Silwood1]|nr:unnamed protein product [Rotaria sp. Silwood1]
MSTKIDKECKQSFKPMLVKTKYQIDLLHKRKSYDLTIEQKVSFQCKLRINNDIYLSESEHERAQRCQERHSFPLDPDTPQNTKIDLHDNGSPFVTDWFLFFTNGQLKLTFDRIFDSLIDGIQKEGQLNFETRLTEMINFLLEIRNEKPKMSKDKRMKNLQEACAKLYTKGSFLFHVVNRALRENDRSKLASLGPYCYLVYTYIGSQLTEYFSIRHNLRRHIKSTESSLMIVYRGDSATNKKINEYWQAAGQKDKYFKWLIFVSTSLDENVAKTFARNILYEIELDRNATNDQFVHLENVSYYRDEREVLLRPGVRFRVNRVNQMKSDEKINFVRVYITIIPSYISNLI